MFRDDRVELHRITGSGKGRMGFGDRVSSGLLKENWEDLEFQVLEDGEYDVDQPLRFLTVRVPATLVQELVQHGAWYERLAEQPLVEVVVGTPEGLERLDAGKE